PTAPALRRFEIRVYDARELRGVERVVKIASRKEAMGRPAIERFEEPPLLVVRLEGPPSAVSGVMTRISSLRGAHIRNDILKIRRDEARKRGRLRGGPLYPDLTALAQIGADSLPQAGGAKPATVAIVESDRLL